MAKTKIGRIKAKKIRKDDVIVYSSGMEIKVIREPRRTKKQISIPVRDASYIVSHPDTIYTVRRKK